jgi:glycolate oxidase
MNDLLSILQNKLPPGVISFNPDDIHRCAADKWATGFSLPEAVALPNRTEEVSTILCFAHKHRIPVTPRGAGVGYCGGAVPAKGGLVLSLERMNCICEISEKDFVAVTQPGVITADLQAEVEKRGLYYPPDPAGRAESSIGGNFSTNAGGPRCLKYGVTRDYVLGIEVVLPDGSICKTGGRTHKNKTGFDLCRFFVGAEGLLGVVTELTLKLIPLPPFRSCLSVGFSSMPDAATAICKIFAAGFLPSALELADAFTLEATWKRTGSDIFKDSKAHLILEMDGQEESVRGEISKIDKIIRTLECRSMEIAHGTEKCESIWNIRREFSYALKDTGLKKLNHDIVIPRGRLVDFFVFTDQLQKRFGIPIACFGHAGDGNIHTNVMVDENKPEQLASGHEMTDLIFKQVLEWGGKITGEHGIGLAKLRWWNQGTSKEERELHSLIKKALDPHGIMNPGKFV